MQKRHQHKGMNEITDEDQESYLQDKGSVGIETHGVIAKKDDRAVLMIRLLTFFVLVAVALAVTLSVYFLAAHSEQNDFQDAFHDKASKVIFSFANRARTRVLALNAFAVELISHAHNTNSTWPAVTMPDFEVRGQFTLELASLISIVLCPIVTEAERSVWEAHSAANRGWLADGLAIQEQNRDPNWTRPENWTDIVGEISPMIVDLNGSYYDENHGPFTPTWETVPSIPWPQAINYNLISNSKYTDAMQAAMDTGDIVLSRTYVPFNLSLPEEQRKTGVLYLYIERWNEGGNEYLFDPVSDLVYPIYDMKNGTRQIVALFKCFIYWRTYFLDILPTGDGPLVCVLQNSCGDVYSYEIAGRDVQYLGEGDLHDPKFNHLYQQADFSSFQGTLFSEQANREGLCLYSLRVYPTPQMEDDYITTTPIIFVVVLALVFVFTSMVFITYDCLVQRRQKQLTTEAIQSGTIVSNLFPKAIRDRIYKETAAQIQLQQQQQQTSGKNRLVTFSQKHAKSFNVASLDGESSLSSSSEPIADLFEDCTVFFADIAGFTNWSADRQPTEVFKLLESIYEAFDKIARKRGVFKIETIGDCYVAVTGLPEPQENHAVIMACFATECLSRLNEVKASLVPTLGEKTMDLCMRVGLHSGPVTAGVIRSERSRFQLFGDTVNTAARMEQTGNPGKIQISYKTANALVSHGRDSWIEKRDEKVFVKGKGDMDTYWLNPLMVEATMTLSRHDRNSMASSSQEAAETVLASSEECIERPESCVDSNDMNTLEQRLAKRLGKRFLLRK